MGKQQLSPEGLARQACLVLDPADDKHSPPLAAASFSLTVARSLREVLSASPSLKEVLGFSPSEFRGQLLGDIFGNDAAARMAEVLEKSDPVACWLLSKNGTRTKFEVSLGKAAVGAASCVLNFAVQTPTELLAEVKSEDGSDSPTSFSHVPHKRTYKYQPKQTTDGRRCSSCNTNVTPEWRRGPLGPKTLCNACGLQFAKKFNPKSSSSVKEEPEEEEEDEDLDCADEKPRKKPKCSKSTPTKSKKSKTPQKARPVRKDSITKLSTQRDTPASSSRRGSTAEDELPSPEEHSLGSNLVSPKASSPSMSLEPSPQQSPVDPSPPSDLAESIPPSSFHFPQPNIETPELELQNALWDEKKGLFQADEGSFLEFEGKFGTEPHIKFEDGTAEFVQQPHPMMLLTEPISLGQYYPLTNQAPFQQYPLQQYPLRGLPELHPTNSHPFPAIPQFATYLDPAMAVEPFPDAHSQFIYDRENP